MSQITIELDAETATRLTAFAASQGKSIRDAVKDAVNFMITASRPDSEWDEGGNNEPADAVDALLLAEYHKQRATHSNLEKHIWSVSEVKARYGLDN
ncbi:MAG: hypothetical protein ORN98_00600 [Alphaproteobacteria bacterium]|nr:hypothetical protein [Alphaproteobacteria bacterium]